MSIDHLILFCLVLCIAFDSQFLPALAALARAHRNTGAMVPAHAGRASLLPGGE